MLQCDCNGGPESCCIKVSIPANIFRRRAVRSIIKKIVKDPFIAGKKYNIEYFERKSYIGSFFTLFVNHVPETDKKFVKAYIAAVFNACI